MVVESQPLAIRVSETEKVSGLLSASIDCRAAFVFAHGAGAGMTHPFMTSFAAGLAARDVATLRFQFPYMERGSKRPDVPRVAHAAVRAAVEEATRRLPGVPLFAGGKSFGGRMTSQAQAESPLPGVHGLIFVAFPLHPAGKPSQERADHLSNVNCPTLFLQGTRDELADLDLLTGVVQRLGSRATLKLFIDADHSFHVPARSGTNDEAVQRAMIDEAVGWISRVLLRPA
ncbi:MAG: alpha/beta hydrolase family protein [Burkholderiaceae bacterium]